MSLLLPWANDLTLEFIDLYGNEPCIWNPKHPDYKNRKELHDAWERIRTALSQQFSVDFLKRKKESIMTVFRAHVRRKKKNPNYKPLWFCYERIERFLGEIYYGDECVELAENGVYYPYLKKRRSGTPVNRRNKTSTSTANPSASMPIKREIEPDPPRYTTTTTRSHLEELDECQLYGQLLAKKLRRLDQHQRDIAMHEIDNIMFTAKMRNDSDKQRHSDSQARRNTQSPLFIISTGKQNEDQYDEEYLEDPMQD